LPASPGTAYAPTLGKLAAAIATIWARRRLIRDGAELSNEPNCRISPIPHVTAEAIVSQMDARKAKMFSPPACVEAVPKIATHPLSDGGSAVDLLLAAARQRSKSSPRDLACVLDSGFP
jgi:hypothetical protein